MHSRGSIAAYLKALVNVHEEWLIQLNQICSVRGYEVNVQLELMESPVMQKWHERKCILACEREKVSLINGCAAE